MCAVCGREGRQATEVRSSELIEFADHEPLPDGMPGHPRGTQWFCPDHAEAARALRSLSEADALRRLREERSGRGSR